MCPLCMGGRKGGGRIEATAVGKVAARAGRLFAARIARPASRERDETCPISTERWTKCVHFVWEGGGGRIANRKARLRESQGAQGRASRALQQGSGTVGRRLHPARRGRRRVRLVRGE